MQKSQAIKLIIYIKLLKCLDYYIFVIVTENVFLFSWKESCRRSSFQQRVKRWRDKELQIDMNSYLARLKETEN